MGTTTYAAIRDAMITQIEGVTPTWHSSVTFKANQAQREFSEWAESNPGGALRRFAILNAQGDDEEFYGNLDVRWQDVICTIQVAYPNDFRYGDDQGRDQGDLMREDYYTIDSVAGVRGGFENFADTAITFIGRSEEVRGPVTIMVIDYRVRYYRAT